MKSVWFLLVVLLAIGLSGCKQKQVDSQDYDQNLFDVFYESKDYTIMKRIEIDEEQVLTAIGYGIGDGYMLGEYHRINFYVQVDEAVYYLDDGVKMGLYTAQDLVDIGLARISKHSETN